MTRLHLRSRVMEYHCAYELYRSDFELATE
jgi:hypothetical protein